MFELRIAALVAPVALLPSLALAAGGLLPQGCAVGQVFTKGAISVSGAFTRATAPHAQSAGGYFTIRNNGASADTFMGASSDAASDVALHQMKMNGQVMEMAPVAGGLEIPPGGAVSLDPMGYHLMLTGLAGPFVAGQCVALTLHFAQAGDLDIELNIGSLSQSAPPQPEAPPSQSGGMDMSSMSMPM
ncbi:MAG TPA: copper chaperone PCu(A)C [Devosia sp.]|nr:copper chaperone PCu(A)C [Devosia sp.]